MRSLSIIFALTAVALTAPTAAGQVSVVGQGMASTCSQYAFRQLESRFALRACNLALEGEAMPPETTAATFVNRGILLMRQKSYELAAADFNEAEHIRPRMAEIFLNRGALLIRQGQHTAAIAQIDKGLELNPSQPEKGYFNRALAYEALGEFERALADFRRAQTLKPDWLLPQQELNRYTVAQR